jgi:hypothetical protein
VVFLEDTVIKYPMGNGATNLADTSPVYGSKFLRLLKYLSLV